MKESPLIVVTPCKNEENILKFLIHSMVGQNLKPFVWVIVDDGSTDKTGEIIADAEKKYEWIKGVHLRECKVYMGSHIHFVCNAGFEFAVNYSKKNNKLYEYIALVDADNILEERYFEKIIQEFEKNPKLGIASGNSAFAEIDTILNNLRLKYADVNVMSNEFWQMWNSPFMQIQKVREDFPMGSARIWRRDCFEQTGGYLPVPLPDSVSNGMAKLKGWKTIRFMDIKVVERRGLAKQGMWKGYRNKGENYYFLDFPLVFAILKAFKYSLEKPYYNGIAFIWGFIKSLAYRKEKVNDIEIRRYYRYVHPKELKDYYRKKIKRLLIK